MGLVSLGWMWLKMARVGPSRARRWRRRREFHEAKLVTARFYAERELPLSGALRRKIEAGAELADGAVGGSVLTRGGLKRVNVYLRFTAAGQVEPCVRPMPSQGCYAGR